MKSKRNLILLITILGFLVTAPLVTLYTAGFRYHWKKQRFERVGFFEASTVPTGAEVVVDGNAVGKTPYVDMNILPGRYTLELSKPGYRGYSTSFEARSGLSTLMLNVLLWKDAQPTLVAETASTAMIDPSGTSLAWTESIPGGTAALISLISGEKRKLSCVLKSGNTPRVSWNESGSAVLFTVATSSGLDGCVATMAGNSFVFADLMSSSAQSVDWSPFDDSHLLVRTNGAGLVIAYERKEVRTVSTKPVPFTIRGSKLFGVRAIPGGMELFSQSLGTLPIPFGSDLEALPPGSYTFLPSPEKYLVLREARHGRIDVFETKSLDRLATVIADHLIFEPDAGEDRFLAVNGHELSLYDVRAETSRLIIRHSEPISSVIWHPLGDYAIAQIGGNIMAIPFEKSAEDAVVLAPMQSSQSMWIDEQGDTLLTIGTNGATTGVWELPLKE